MSNRLQARTGWTESGTRHKTHMMVTQMTAFGVYLAVMLPFWFDTSGR